jgi:lipoprotein NlpI
MGRRLFAALAAMCVAGTVQGAHAAAYDDFAQGLSAYERGDFAAAIPAFTAAINAGDLAPNLKPTAYLDRARAYIRIGQCKPALTDLSAPKLLDASNIEITEALALSEACVADFKAADADFTAAITANPLPGLIWARGHERWDAGDFAGAAADFEVTRSAKPSYAYAVLWLAVAQLRMGSDEQALAHASDIDFGAWPGPVVRLYLGKIQPDVVNAAAAQGDAATVKNQQCEANFYIAEWLLAQKNVDKAKNLLQTAADACPQDFIERRSAKIELDRLR